MSTHDADWIGRITEARGIATAAPLEGLAALFDWPDPPDVLPPLAHWLYCLTHTPQEDLGADGHAKLGRTLPDLGLARRMWAGGRIQFFAAIPIGAALLRRTTITDIQRKTGSTGPLAFVRLRHEIVADGVTAVVEEQDIVYRAPAVTPAPATPDPPPPGEVVSFDPVKLFRFSALTFNGHRIHYDLAYARDAEGYPNLVVHGPYQAMMLMDRFRRAFPNAAIGQFAFRARAPLFCHERAVLHIAGGAPDGALALYAEDGRLCMTAAIGP